MPPVPTSHLPEGPSVWQKLKMGAVMGGGVGLTIGFIFGSWSIIRGGAGPRGFLATLSQYMLSSAATFSFFLAIGSVIRSDTLIPPYLQAAHMQMLAPAVSIRSKSEGFQLMKSRWEAERLRHAQQRE
ncbi:reactive mitochondrial oxygen species modulator 1-domain-containing protein [Cyathus striatus]|nr:reactive mitochondrial oxygen species modulator 1-domain-containing protein [Cyathus striatus]